MDWMPTPYGLEAKLRCLQKTPSEAGLGAVMPSDERDADRSVREAGGADKEAIDRAMSRYDPILDPIESPPPSKLIDYALKLARAFTPLAAAVQRMWRAATAADAHGFDGMSAMETGTAALREIDSRDQARSLAL